MVEVRGAWAKNQGGPSLFLKILHTKKKNLKKKNLGSSPLCPLPGSVPRPINFLCPPIVWFHLSLELGMNAKFWKKKKKPSSHRWGVICKRLQEKSPILNLLERLIPKLKLATNHFWWKSINLFIKEIWKYIYIYIYIYKRGFLSLDWTFMWFKNTTKL